MAINTADKIFIDVDDEINFVVEKILKSKRSRIILAVPQNALVISSLVSMKILAKQIAKSKKLLVIVTEDKFGMQLTERSGLVSTNKVSNIKPEMWEVAQVKKEKIRAEMEDVKNNLLVDRGALPDKAEVEEGGEGEEEKVERSKEAKDDLPAGKAGERQLKTMKDEESSKDAEDSKEREEKGEVGEGGAEKKPTVEESDVKGAIQRKRRDAKLVSVGAFQVYAGGDIASINASKGGKMGIVSDSKEMENEPETLESQKDGKGFTGRDWGSATKAARRNLSVSNLFSFGKKRGGGPGDRMEQLQTEPREPIYKNKILWAGLAIFVVLGIVAMYVLAFVLSSVEIKINLKTADVPIEQQITADTDPSIIDVDPDRLIIPARLIQEEVNGSESGKATGEGKRGEKAAGLIEIWNRTSAEITFPKGTIVTNPSTNLKYLLDTDHTVPAGVEDGNGIINSGGQGMEVRVVAAKFGEEYNVDANDETVVWQVKGFSTSDVDAKRFNAITGGTTETFKAVSKANIKEVEEVLLNRLEEQGRELLSSLVYPDEVLLAGTEEFEAGETVSNPAQGEETQKTFNVNIEMTISAVVVEKDDLDEAISALVAKNDESEINFEVDSLSASAIDNISREDGKVTFTVTSEGNLRSKVNEEELKFEIAGMSIEQAEEYLNYNVPEIDSARIIYTPQIVPNFLKRIPTEVNKIRFVF